jgi:NADPH:quinone reductase-like Zn-dependent oxidoreductase
MRAAVVQRYGPPDVVEVRDVARPAPGPREVLVRVESAAVSSGDARIRGARFPDGFGPFARLAFGIGKPRRPILGGTFSGVVEALGADVAAAGAASNVAIEDRVCGMTGTRMGTHAQYAVVRADKLCAVPVGVTHDDAAGVLFGGTTAWHFLHDRAAPGPGSSVLVNGASGAIGTNAVQLAARMGATVTAVTSDARRALMTELGASVVVDHTRQDVTSLDERYDVVFDAVGNLSIASGRRLLRDDGTLVLAVAGLMETLRARGRVVAGAAPERTEAMAHLLDMVAAGELRVIIDHVVGLDDIVDAHRCVDAGHKLGNVIVHPWSSAG